MTKKKAPPLTPNEEQLMFYQEHSLCITQFAGLEQELAGIIALGRDRTTATALQTAFFGIESFRSKLEFVDRFVQELAVENRAQLDLWRDCHETTKQAQERRNKLAHWSLVVYADDIPGRRVVLVPPPLNPSHKFRKLPQKERAGTAPAYAVGVRQLTEIRLYIAHAYMKLLNFQLRALEAKNVTFDVSLKEAPMLAEMTDTFRAWLKMSAANV